MRAIIDRIVVGDSEIAMHLDRQKLAYHLLGDKSQNSDAPPVEPAVLTIAAKLARAGKGTKLVVGNTANLIDPNLASVVG